MSPSIDDQPNTGQPEPTSKLVPEEVSSLSPEECQRRLQAAARIFATGAIRAAIAARHRRESETES
jgi:hypothetical protein